MRVMSPICLQRHTVILLNDYGEFVAWLLYVQGSIAICKILNGKMCCGVNVRPKCVCVCNCKDIINVH